MGVKIHRFKKGQTPPIHKEKCGCFRCTRIAWNKGIPFNEETRRKMSISAKGIHKSPETEIKKGEHLSSDTEMKKGNIESQSISWKGDEVGYVALHIWVSKKLGKATKCSNNTMHVSKRFVWANISGEYKRDLSDWHELCPSCNLTDGVKVAERFSYNGGII